MPELRNQVRNEAFGLLRLCTNLTEFIQSSRAKKTYLIETEEFLNYIAESLKAIERFIRQVINRPPEDEIIKSRLRDLGEIRKALYWLYVLTKQAIDSDSLSIPFSLATFLNHMAKKLPKPKRSRLVLLGGSNLMYYKWNLIPIQDINCR